MIENNCDGSSLLDEADLDGDGQAVCASDCDDFDPTIYTGAPELCDGLDNDCNTVVDDGVDDSDTDGICDALDPCPGDDPDDSDLDGVCDSDDTCAGFDDNADLDNDGLPDGCDACPIDATDDVDGDGVCGQKN